MEITEKRLSLRRRNRLPMLILAVVSALCVIFLRSRVVTVIPFYGINIAYTDIFIILAAGIGGLESGLLSFVILFIAEFVRSSEGYGGLYAVFIYLLIALVVARLAYMGRYRNLLGTLYSSLLVAIVLAVSWLVTFTVLIPGEETENVYTGLSLWRLFLGALPESILSSVMVALFFRFAPDKVKYQLGSGWVYTSGRKDGRRRFFVLGLRLIALSLAEALLLVAVAVVVSSIFEATATRNTFTFTFFMAGWKNHLRMGLLMLCAAVPIAYLLNQLLMVYVINPINAMSFLMDQYFEEDEKERDRRLPELDIHTGDEIERLYQSLQKMVGDMGDYIDRVLDEERKSAHLTQGFMIALAKAVDAKDRYTSGHSARVAAYSGEIAKRMGKTEEEQEQIYTMGLLHDIGKIGVPEAIINKNGRLTDEEFAKIKEHPGIGHEILKNVTELPGLATGARWHHERYGGGGYPDGLSGLDIPEEARIIAVADAYDAMTSNRAYSNVRPQEEVRAEILRCKGSQFDPGIADIMIAMIDDDTEYKMREIKGL